MVVSLRATSALGRIFGWSSLSGNKKMLVLTVVLKFISGEILIKVKTNLHVLICRRYSLTMALKDYRPIFERLNNCINSPHFWCVL